MFTLILEMCLQEVIESGFRHCDSHEGTGAGPLEWG